MILTRFSPARWLPDLWATFSRFPIPVLCTVIGVIVLTIREERWLLFSHNSQSVIIGTGICAFLLSGGLHLLAESRAWSRIRNIGLALGVALLTTLYGYLHKPLQIEYGFLLCAAVLWVMIAGYLRTDVQFGSFWQFNSRLVQAGVIATIVGLICMAGLFAIFAGFDFLYGTKLRRIFDEHILRISVFIVGPVFGLSLLPGSLNEQFETSGNPDNLLERGITLLVNYILVPLLLIYAAILYSYVVAIAIEASLPKGKVGFMVLAFGLGGIATWLIAKPWEDTGTVLVRIFVRYYFWLLPVPILLVWLAFYERVDAYGLTPARIGLALFAVWLIFTTGYFALRRTNIRAPLILAALAVLVGSFSFGPWGARALSVDSQVSRLADILQDLKLLENGKFQLASVENLELDKEKSREIRSIIRFVKNHNGRAQMTDTLGDVQSKHFNMKFVPESFVSYHSQTGITRTIQTSGAILYGPFAINLDARKPSATNGKISVEVSDGSILIANTSNGNRWTYPTLDLLQRAHEAKKSNDELVVVELKEASGGPPASLMAWAVSGYLNGKKKGARQMRGMILISGPGSSND